MESLDRLYPLLHLDICSVTYVRCIFYFSFAISEIVTTFGTFKIYSSTRIDRFFGFLCIFPYRYIEIYNRAVSRSSNTLEALL